MSGVTSGSRLSRNHPLVAARLTLGAALAYLLGGLALVAALYVIALAMYVAGAR